MREGGRKTSGDGLNDHIRVSSSELLVIVDALSLVLVIAAVWRFIRKNPGTIIADEVPPIRFLAR